MSLGIPSKCPECGHFAILETYEWKQIDTESKTRDATCKKCKTTFFEIYKCVGWETL